MTDPLAEYLADHLAGSLHAIESLKNLRDAYAKDELGQFAEALLAEVEADRDVLQHIAHLTAKGPIHSKELAAWLAEKVSRLKLRHEQKDSLGTFEMLEHLALGIQGKYGLWRALDTIAGSDPRLQCTDFKALAQRALDQYARVEERRLNAAPRVLAAKA